MKGNKFSNWVAAPGSQISAPFVCGGLNVGGAQPLHGNCVFEENYVLNNNRFGVGYTHFSTGSIRRNTLTLTSTDPILYLVGAHDMLIEDNVILQKADGSNEGAEFPAVPVISIGLEEPVQTANRNLTVRHNLIGYGYAHTVSFLITPGFPSETADLQSMYNLTLHNNTLVQTHCCGSTVTHGNTLSASDNRSTPDPGDWSGITWRDNLHWNLGPYNTIGLGTGLATQFTIDRNLYHTATTLGGNLGTNPLSTNTVPFVAYSAGATAFSGSNNYNLTSTTVALGSGTDGGSRGAFEPPQLQSVVIANATPTMATWTFTTAKPLVGCTAGGMTLSGLTITGCSVASSTTITTPFTGTVTAGQAITAGLQQGAAKATAVGCSTAQCQSYGLTEHTRYWSRENFPYSGVAVTNQVQSGCAPTVINCTIPDSASDDHVIFTLDSCESDPILPASGITGFTITEQDAGTKTCSTFTRSGSTQLDCDTTAVTAGKTVTWSYATAAAGPTTPELDNCNGGEIPMTTGWSEDIDSDHVGAFQETPNMCLKGGAAGEGSAWRDSGTFGPDSEIWGIWGDATHTSGFFDFHVRIQQVNTPAPESYACRVDFSTDPETISLVEYTDGSAAILTSTTQALDTSHKLLCRVVGSTLSVWHSAGSTWTQLLSTTDATLSAAGHIGMSSNTGNVALDSVGGGTYTAAGSGNVTNTAGTPLAPTSGSCTNQVAAPPAAPFVVDWSIPAGGPTNIHLTVDPAGGTMTLNGGGCAGISCTQNGTGWPLTSCVQTTNTRLTVTTTTAMTGGAEVRCSYAPASGNWTNGSAEVVGFTNQLVTNNLPVESLVRTQYGVRLHAYNESDTLTPGSAFWLGPQNQPIAVMPGGSVLVALGYWVTGDAAPAEALSVRCQDDGGAPYAPADTYGGQLVRYVQSGSTYAHLQGLPTRPLTHPSPGTSTYDGAGRVLTAAGDGPTQARPEQTDTVLAPVLQVRPIATDGQTIACYLVTGSGVEFAPSAYTPAKGTALITVRERLARGL